MRSDRTLYGRVEAALLRAVAAALVLVLGSGCVYPRRGPALVFKPGGETVTVEPARGVAVTGELIAVEAERLVLLSGGRYLAVPLASLRGVAVEGYPRVSVERGQPQLRLYARYPQGLGPEQWRVLLQATGQEAPDPFPQPARARAAGGGPEPRSGP